MQSFFNPFLKRLGSMSNNRDLPSDTPLDKNDPLLNEPVREQKDTVSNGGFGPRPPLPKSPEEKIHEPQFNKPDIKIIFFDPRLKEAIDKVKRKAGIEDPSDVKTKVTDLGLLRIQLKSLNPWFRRSVIVFKNGQIVGTDDRAELIADLLSSVNAKLRFISSAVRQQVIADSKRILTVKEEIKRGYRKPIQVIRQPRVTR